MKDSSASWLPPTPLKPLRKSAYKERVASLRLRLLKLQHSLRHRDFPVLIVFGGVDGGGKHETVNLLNEWLDPRYLRTLAYTAASQEEEERPRMWRYWRDLPVRGRIALVLSGWYSQPLVEFARHRSDEQRFQRQIREIQDFERMISDDGGLILKFWMHLSARQQSDRLRQLAEDPLTIWQAKPQDWEHLQLYDRFVGAANTMLQATHHPRCPWQVVDGSQPQARALHVAEAIADALEQALKDKPASPSTDYKASRKKHLAKADLDRSLDKKEYQERLEAAQSRLPRLQRTSAHRGSSTLLVFEGWDAAGKGGAIRRLISPLDARQYRLIPIGAPNDEEAARHYLWRFWRELPRAGQFCIFDRSWYGRVLVERIEGFAEKAEWQRAYEEIRIFEQELCESGIRLLKFWLHISPQEQLKRFEARRDNPLKSWKLTEEDWRNRERWDEYEKAVNDMLEHTHSDSAPWHVIAGNDKRHARVQVLETVCEAMLRS